MNYNKIYRDRAIQKEAQNVTSSIESAKQFLLSAGIMDKHGNLAKLYR